MKVNKTISKAIKSLLEASNLVETKKWQAIEISYKMYEVNNLFLKMDICSTVEKLAKETNANLPWSEDHFQERLLGATNPGLQYKNWPFYRESEHNKLFREKGTFSHTYQERFWPPAKKGVRFKMGDYLDIKERLKKDYSTRQAFLSIWHPEDQSNHNERLPCTIGYWFQINKNKLNVTYLIRSCDAVRHFRNDIYMTQRLCMDVLEYLGDKNITLGEMNMWIGSFHCFESDLYYLQKSNKKNS